jgi:hypothetical protein
MTWNYRIVEYSEPVYRKGFGLHEVYYKDGRDDSMSEEPVAPIASSMAELRERIDLILSAFEKPVLKSD